MTDSREGKLGSSELARKQRDLVDLPAITLLRDSRKPRHAHKDKREQKSEMEKSESVELR